MKFDSPTRARLLEALRAGATDSIACGCARITPSGLMKWKKQGKDALDANRFDDEHAQFYLDYQSARGALAHELLNRIKEAGAEARHWNANAWMLERAFQKDYGKPPVDQPKQQEPKEDAELTAEQRLAKVTKLLNGGTA